MRKPANLKWKLLVLGLSVLLVAVWIILQLPCVIRCVTGLICPGCGMTRAWLAVLRLDIVGAFQLHPMFWSVPVLALFAFYDGLLFKNRRVNKLVLGGLIVGLLLCYLIRLNSFLSGSLPL